MRSPTQEEQNEEERLINAEILRNFPVLNHFMPVLLSLQSLGVAPGDVDLSSTTKISMRIWRIIVWFTFLAYSVVVSYTLLFSPAANPRKGILRLEVVDMVMVFVAAVTANLLHNFQKVSFLKIVHTLNEMGTQSQIKPQSEFEGSRCFLMSLMNLLCHITGAVIYLVYEDPVENPLECTESVIRMLLLSTTLMLQVRNSDKIRHIVIHDLRWHRHDFGTFDFRKLLPR